LYRVKGAGGIAMKQDTNQALDFLKKGIAQLAIIVEDLDTAVKNYWDIFGIGPWYFYTYGKPLVKRMSYHGRETEYKMRLALSNIGPLRIELIEAMEGETIYADFIKKHGYGFHHLGILVDDVKKKVSEAESRGIKMIQDGSGFGKEGDGHYAYLDTEDLLGVTLEFIQRPKERVHPEKIYPPET
jgi:methylmalonyl-CoA/ethylmalonyl-CoA epimerase